MATITAAALYIGGTLMPTPKAGGVKISKNKIWSSDTGRVASGYMEGTLVAVKRKVEIQWPPLTRSQVSTIESKVTGQWTTLKIIDLTGSQFTMNCYFGDPSGSWYSWVDGIAVVQDYTVNAIER